MKNIRKYTELKDFYIGDIHEDNFLVDTEKQEIFVADLDSCKIADYKVTEETDIYCYIIMILNYLYDGRVDR